MHTYKKFGGGGGWGMPPLSPSVVLSLSVYNYVTCKSSDFSMFLEHEVVSLQYISLPMRNIKRKRRATHLWLV